MEVARRDYWLGRGGEEKAVGKKVKCIRERGREDRLDEWGRKFCPLEKATPASGVFLAGAISLSLQLSVLFFSSSSLCTTDRYWSSFSE